MRATDHELQPVENELTGAARRAAEVAANDARIRRMYDESYGGWMAGRGDVVPSPAPALSASAPVGPSLSNAHGGPAPVGGWTLLAPSHRAATGTPRNANDALWRRESADPPADPGRPIPIYSLPFADGPRAVLLRAAGQAACDNGPNGALVTRDYALCPAKVAVLDRGRIVTERAADTICVEAINDGGVRPSAPGWQDPARWGTRSQHDAPSRTIGLVTLQDGRREPACSARMRVP